MKVIGIEEAHDIAMMKFDELFGSLRTFEMSFNDKPDKKSKNIALQSSVKPDVVSSKNKESDENLAQSISLLAKQFKKALRRWDKHSVPRNSNLSPNGQDNFGSSGRSFVKNYRSSDRKVDIGKCFSFNKD